MIHQAHHPGANTAGVGRADPRQKTRKEGHVGGAAKEWEGPEVGRQILGPKPWPIIVRLDKAEGLISILVSCIRGVAGCPRRRGRPGSPAKPEAWTRGKASPQYI